MASYSFSSQIVTPDIQKVETILSLTHEDKCDDLTKFLLNETGWQIPTNISSTQHEYIQKCYRTGWMFAYIDMPHLIKLCKESDIPFSRVNKVSITIRNLNTDLDTYIKKRHLEQFVNVEECQ